MAREDGHFRLRIPNDVKSWVRANAEKNMRSLTAEIVFTLREKMATAAGEGFADTSPAAVQNDEAAFAGRPI